MDSVGITELEYMRLQRIRHELQDYRYYLLKKSWLLEKIELCDIKLNGQIPALKTDEIGGGALQGNWIVATIEEQDELRASLNEVQRHIDLVENWLRLVEVTLGKEYMFVLSVYAINNGYKNVEKCVEELKLSNDRKLHRSVSRAENCILENVKNFKNF